MKRKTIATAALMALLLLTLTACGRGEADPPASAASAARQAESSEESAGTSSAAASGEDEDWKRDFEESLLENYGVVPERYEDLGDGIYQVYVEIDGKSVPYVAVDSATGDYHG